MGIYFLKEEAFSNLITNIAENKDIYLAGEFSTSDFTKSEISFESKGTLDPEVLKTLQEPFDNKNYELENSVIVFRAFREITRYQASDPRMWSFYCHTFATKYARARYAKKFNNEVDLSQLIGSVRMHFFGGNQSRELLRNNLLARLWWNYRLVMDVDENLAEDLLKVLLVNSDHRNSFVERPTQFSTNAVKARLLYSFDKYKNDPSDIYFEAPRGSKDEQTISNHYNYRAAARFLNLLGGTINLNLLSCDEIIDLMFEDEMKFYSNGTYD